MFISYKQKKKQKGYALILSIFVATFFLTLTALTSQYTLGALKSTRTEFQKLAQARNVAEAGLQEAAFWFENQPSFTSATITSGIWTDPSGIWTLDASGNLINVSGSASILSILSNTPQQNKHHLAFRPRVATSTVDRGDTDDPRGIIRDIPIDNANNLYGHYEVLRYDPTKWKSLTTDPNAGTAVMDISDEKLAVLNTAGANTSSGTGRYWRVVSNGTLYYRNPKAMTIDSKGVFVKPYTDPTSCKILGNYTLSENILKINYTGKRAAVLLNDCAKFTQFTNSTITANVNSLDHTILCPDPTVLPPAISSSTAIKALTGNGIDIASKFSTENVFGISSQEIKGVANQRETDASKLKRDAQGRFGSSEIIYLDGTSSSTTFEFNETSPLKGGGILYVNSGNLKLKANGGALYTGIIYLKTGNLIVEELNSLSGSIFLENGSLSVDGGGNKVDFGYNNNVMTGIMNAISVYKEDSLSYKSIFVK